MDKLILAFCRLGFAGLSPIMPGTCGSALAVVLAPFLFIPLPFVARIVVLVLVFWIGGMAATRGEQILGYKDPGEIVIDELLGMWLVLLPFPILVGRKSALPSFYSVFSICGSRGPSMRPRVGCPEATAL